MSRRPRELRGRSGPSEITPEDLERFATGEDTRLFEKFGAQLVTIGGEAGVRFAVWAPNATRVSVIGSFNGWDGEAHVMSGREHGVWELFVPGVSEGALYKYEIVTRLEGRRSIKADPFGFAMQLPPDTASVVWDLDRYRWGDDDWLEVRAELQRFDQPINVYEVHLGSWRRAPAGPDDPEAKRLWLTYAELAERLVPYALEMGYTHLELLPITEHPFDGSWGYQTVGYFAPTSRFGTPDDFRGFVDAAHRAGLGIILDWVPGHFPRDAHGLGFFDGTHLYEHGDPRRGLHMDWGTFIYDFHKPQVSSFLISSALFWMDRYHVDGLRVDAVASMLYLDYSREPDQWVPNVHGGRENLEAVGFLQKLNRVVHEEHPGVLTCAEESTSWPKVTGAVEDGGLGFDLKWNMGWMNDMLRYFRLDPLARKHAHKALTFSMTYAFDEKFILPLSHDEVVHGKRSLLSKMPGDPKLRFANLRALYGLMFAQPGKKLLFMGGELAQPTEWNHDAELSWDLEGEESHELLRDYVRALNELYAGERALHEIEGSWDGFEWIDFSDAPRSLISFVRKGSRDRDRIVVIANFTPVVRERYRLVVPEAFAYEIVSNGDDPCFGGSGVEIPSEIEVVDGAIELPLPPLTVLFLKPRPKPFWSVIPPVD